MLRTGILDEENISDQHASRGEFEFTAVAVLILFVICRYMASLIWMQTLSICVAYATNMSRGVPLLFLREKPKSYTA